MGILTAEELKLQQAMAKAQRNDLCPCGSGKKFKFCHGNLAADSPQTK
jgi:uncharacterized protein YecA (UPF0149 family)